MQIPELRDGDTWVSSVDRKAYPDRRVTDAGWGMVHFIESEHSASFRRRLLGQARRQPAGLASEGRFPAPVGEPDARSP